MSCWSRRMVDLASLRGGDFLQPQIDVGGQGDGLCSFLRGIPTGSLEEYSLLLEPLLPLLWCQLLGWMDGFLPGLDTRDFVVVAHGDHDEIAVSPFSDACHIVLTSLSLASFQLRPVWQTQHTESSRQKPSQFLQTPFFYEIDNHAPRRFSIHAAARLKMGLPSGRSTVSMVSAACSFCACWGWQ